MMLRARFGGAIRPRRSTGAAFWVAALALSASACDQVTGPGGGGPPGTARRQAGGATTTENLTSHAFSTPAPNLSGERLTLHMQGDAAFEQKFVAPPAPVNPGLGPIFNQPSCVRCHTGDGRDGAGLLIRVSRPGVGERGGPLPVAGVGLQIQDRAVFGAAPEARVSMASDVRSVTLADGTHVNLERPVFSLSDPSVPIPADALSSPRMPRPVFGLGLLEAVPESMLEALADAGDSDGDGISGRVNRVWNEERQRMEVGRFGWKANEPTLRQQTARAYNEDMGVTTVVFPTESSAGQAADDGRADDPELDEARLAATVLYVQTLAVPAPRDLDDPEVRRGEEIFADAGCGGCHVSSLQTGSLAGVPEVSYQTIYPYTDLLLHDMGEDLADGRPDFEATGSEWRTPPLWGLGLTHVVNGEVRLLHDGRARSILEAILWHGGEAAGARDAVKALSTADREALLRFLESL